MDPSEKMLQEGRRKVQSAGLSSLVTLEVCGLSLSVGGGSG